MAIDWGIVFSACFLTFVVVTVTTELLIGLPRVVAALSSWAGLLHRWVGRGKTLLPQALGDEGPRVQL